jgi:hypothetical protein
MSGLKERMLLIINRIVKGNRVKLYVTLWQTILLLSNEEIYCVTCVFSDFGTKATT